MNYLEFQNLPESVLKKLNTLATNVFNANYKVGDKVILLFQQHSAGKVKIVEQEITLLGKAENGGIQSNVTNLYYPLYMVKVLLLLIAKTISKEVY